MNFKQSSHKPIVNGNQKERAYYSCAYQITLASCTIHYKVLFCTIKRFIIKCTIILRDIMDMIKWIITCQRWTNCLLSDQHQWTCITMTPNKKWRCKSNLHSVHLLLSICMPLEFVKLEFAHTDTITQTIHLVNVCMEIELHLSLSFLYIQTLSDGTE